MTTQPRRFHLQRDTDITGVSGTGHVADGVLWPDGTASVRWVGERPSIVFWERIIDAEAVHGHGGATRIVWDDPSEAGQAEAALARVRTLRAGWLSTGAPPLGTSIARWWDKRLIELDAALTEPEEN